MDIALVNNAWESSGVGKYSFKIMSAYKKFGKNADMIYFENRFSAKSAGGVRILKSPYKLPVFRAACNNYFYFPKKLPEGYDLYHVTNETIARCCKFAKPSVVTCADMFTHFDKRAYDPFTTFLIRKHMECMKYAKKIIAISNSTKKDIIKYLNIPEDRIEVTLLGVDHSVFMERDKIEARKNLGLPENGKFVLHVGVDHPRKNIATLLKVFYEVNKKIPDARLVRVGGLSKRNEKTAEKMGITGKIICLSGLSEKKLALVYNASDAFVFPSLFEGFGLPVLEAMSSGLPVVASNSTSIPEIAGGSGMLFPPNDADGFKDAICRLFSDESFYNEMKLKSKKRASHFSWEKTAKKTWEVYEEAVKK